MAPIPGLNIPADGSIPVADILKILPRGSVLRIVLRDIALFPYLSHWRIEAARYYRLMGVIANESFDFADGRKLELDGLFALLRDWGIFLTYLQVGNEWDHTSDSSWSRTPAQLASLLGDAYSTRNLLHLNHIPIILGGAVSGDATRFADVPTRYIDAVALHPYGQGSDPDGPAGPIPDIDAPAGNFGNVEDLIDQYQERWTGPLFITEVGVSYREVGLEKQAKYVHEFMDRMKVHDDLIAVVYFCLHGYLGFGLYLDDSTEPTPAYQVFLELMKDWPIPPYTATFEEKGKPVPSPFYFDLGIKAHAEKLGGVAVVGEPLENEHDAWHDGHAIAHQLTTKGEFRWYKTQGFALFFPGQ